MCAYLSLEAACDVCLRNRILCAGYVIYSILKERTWFKEVSKKAIKQAGNQKEKTVDKSVAVDKSDYLVGTPHELLQKKKTSKKAK